MIALPRLYAIADATCFTSTEALLAYVHALLEGGVTLLQYRNKTGNARQALSDARELRRICGDSVTLVMNDRADLALAAGFAGVHVGQDDLSVDAVRAVVGGSFMVGLSTHNPEQVREASQLAVHYIAVGPVFPTGSKQNPDPVIGVEGVRRARELTSRPLVAIGGITRENARAVIEAGADSVAVIGDLLGDPSDYARQFLKILS